MTALVRYDAARKALSECKRVDEVQSIRNKAEAMRAYARMAKNREMELDAAEIRIRSERRLGQLLRAAKDAGQFSQGGRPRKLTERQFARVTLRETGIDKQLSSRAQKLAASPEGQFDKLLSDWRGRLTHDAKSRIIPTLNDPPLPRAARKIVCESGGLLDEMSLPDGRSLGDLRWGELARLAEQYGWLSRFLASLAGHTTPPDYSVRVREAITEKVISAVIKDLGGPRQ